MRVSADVMHTCFCKIVNRVFNLYHGEACIRRYRRSRLKLLIYEMFELVLPVNVCVELYISYSREQQVWSFVALRIMVT